MKKINFKIIYIVLLSYFIFGCVKENNSSSELSQNQSSLNIQPGPQSDDEQNQPPTPTPDSGPELIYNFSINNDDRYTNLSEVNLILTAPVDIKSIKIGQNSDCSDGVIEKFESHLKKSVFSRNHLNQFSIQFLNFSHEPIACISKSILHDDTGPEIIFNQYPLAQIEEGRTTEIKYSVKDISKVKEVKCSLNDLEKPCDTGLGSVTLDSLAEGRYSFKIEATDEWGFTSSQSVQWSVVNLTQAVSQVVAIKEERKVDILIVVDNSASMKYEQKNMANRVSNMLGVLNGLDWQIAVTTTDPRDIALGDGRLLPIYGTQNQYIVNSAMKPDEAQYKLGMTLQRPETGSGSEQPIYATYRFIERSLANDSANQNFFRQGAHFSVIVISDEDESANTEKNDPGQLIKLISTTFKEQKVFTWNSIITQPNDVQCLKTNGATYGSRLAQLSQLSGGVIGSVCESDYATQLTGIATGIVNMNKSISLTCDALTEFPIQIKKDGVEYSKAFVREGLNLKFNEVLEAGSYSLEYRCLK